MREMSVTEQRYKAVLAVIGENQAECLVGRKHDVPAPSCHCGFWALLKVRPTERAGEEASPFRAPSRRAVGHGLRMYSHFVLPSRGCHRSREEARGRESNTPGVLGRRHADVGTDFSNRGSQVRILSPAPHPPSGGQVPLKRDNRPSADAPALYRPVAMPSLNRYK